MRVIPFESSVIAPFDGKPGPGVEVFSLMREIDLTPTDYINAFFDTGREYQRPIVGDS